MQMPPGTAQSTGCILGTWVSWKTYGQTEIEWMASTNVVATNSTGLISDTQGETQGSLQSCVIARGFNVL